MKYDNLLKDEAIRTNLTTAAAQYPEIETLLASIEQDLASNGDLSDRPIGEIALRAQFECGARRAVTRIRAAFSPLTASKKNEPEELVPWGRLLNTEADS